MNEVVDAIREFVGFRNEFYYRSEYKQKKNY